MVPAATSRAAVRRWRQAACALLVFACAGLVAAAPAAAGVGLSLTASTLSAVPGETVRLTATVSGWNAGDAVRFLEAGNQTALADVAIAADGTAPLDQSFPEGTHAITAQYLQGGFLPLPGVVSNAVTIAVASSQVVKTDTATVLSVAGFATPSPTFTATVTSTPGTPAPTGTVTFLDSGTSMGTAPVEADGTATLTPGTLPTGDHSIVARYEGDAHNLGSSSATYSGTIAAPPAVRTLLDVRYEPKPLAPGESATLWAHVYQPYAQLQPPAGAGVQFWIKNGTTQQMVGDTVGVDSGGYTTAGVNAGRPAPGAQIFATYVGDDAHSAQSDPISIEYASGIVVHAPSRTIAYGDAVPTLSATYSGGTPDVAARCTTTATSASLPGDYPVTCADASSSSSAISYVDGTLTIAKKALTVTAPSATIVYGDPLPALTPTYTGFASGDGPGSLAAAPTCTTTATSASGAGAYPVACSGGADPRYLFVYRAGTLTVQPASVTVTPSVNAAVETKAPVEVSATVTSARGPAAGVTVSFTLAGGTCSAVTGGDGTATCRLTPTGGTGTATLTATAAADAHYLGDTGTRTTLLYAFPRSGGTFAIGDRSDVAGAHVTFWASQWAKKNSLSGGAAPSSFKGYALSGSLHAGGAWLGRTGNSVRPPDGPLPTYIGVIVTSSARQFRSTILGDVVRIAVVKVDPGYDDDPGHAGTGVVVVP